MTARRMTSGLVLKSLNGDYLIMREGYESTLLGSSKVNLTRPLQLRIADKSGVRLGSHFQKNEGAFFSALWIGRQNFTA
ncbi:hypothetical protein [Ruegeria sp. Alg231-54]|uniref:hypothetical protein n=1 Tax=Ruegeria sp. Alg231-54 TaxID=1922221 RepID=UPI0018FFD550|nr:hypothetical protein [Ruegeria sp. Alg231-54]